MTKKALIVMDAGIATEDNLKMVKAKGYDYLCVTRSSLKNYKVEAYAAAVTVTDNKKQKIELCPVKSDKNTDYYLKVESHTKELKERSMNDRFRQRFEEGLQTITESLTKKGGVKHKCTQWRLFSSNLTRGSIPRDVMAILQYNP